MSIAFLKALLCSLLRILGRKGYCVSKTGNVAYGPNAWQRLDIYKPVGLRGRLTTVIVITGGAFSNCDRTAMEAKCRELAALGYCAMTLTYGLPSSGRYGADAMDDVRLAFAWAAGQAYVDPARMGAWGRSAGALIGAWMVMDDGPAKCFVGEAGPYNIVPPTQAHTIAWLNGTDPRAVSPIFAVTPITRPMHLAHGSSDTVVLMQNSVDMKAAMDAAGVPGTLFIHGGGHTNPNTKAEKSALWNSQKAFLAQRL